MMEAGKNWQVYFSLKRQNNKANFIWMSSSGFKFYLVYTISYINPSDANLYFELSNMQACLNWYFFCPFLHQIICRINLLWHNLRHRWYFLVIKYRTALPNKDLPRSTNYKHYTVNINRQSCEHIHLRFCCQKMNNSRSEDNIAL